MSSQAPLSDYLIHMPLSERTIRILLVPFAISRILRRFALPGVVGILLFAIGVWQDLGLAKVIGIILAAPVIWVYVVLLFGYFPYLIFEGIRRQLKRRE